MKHRLAVAASLALPWVSLHAQGSCAVPVSRLLAEIRTVHDTQRNVGIAFAIARGGVVVASGALGSADLEHQIAMSPEALTGVASITKAFTGVTLLRLADQGRIDLDAPIQRYLPDFPVKPGVPITARLLAAHLAGVRHTRADERTPAFLSRHIASPREALALFANDSLVVPVASRYSYTSYGYNLLAAVIEAAAGQPFQDVVRAEVIGPLGLRVTDFDDVRQVLAGRMRRYAYNDPYTYAVTDTLQRVPDFNYSWNAGGGNIRSSVMDLARFGVGVLRPGFLSDTMRALMRQRVRVGEVESPWSSGWFVGTNEPRALYISGSNPGFQGGLYVYPDRDLAIAVLANSWGRGANSGELVIGLPQRVAALCGGWPVP